MTKQELRKMVQEEVEKMKHESRIKKYKKVIETKKLSKGIIKKKLNETKLSDLKGKWEYHPSDVQDMEDILEDQDPNMLSFPHTSYHMQDPNEGGIAFAALSTDGNESFISVTDYDDEEVFYKVYKDWKLALATFKKIVKSSKIKGYSNKKPIVF